jgi:tetratricopeptide (TPR) repeat protein
MMISKQGTRWVVYLLCFFGSIFPVAPAPAQESSESRIQVLLDAGLTEEALSILKRAIRKKPRDANLLLLRSTAHFMDGNLEAGRRDLERSLDLDPELRQAWLNKAALDLSERNYEGALVAFRKAELLDPDADDNSLNIGAVLLFKGDTAEAAERFRNYLESRTQDAEAHYLVAANYAMADRADLAVALLKKAIHLDEKVRLQARTDPNFATITSLPEFREILATDSYQVPVGALTASRSYDFPYTGRDSRVLEAVLSALQLARIPFDQRVEVTPAWALIWSDFRIKVSVLSEGGTRVQLTAAPGSYTQEEWRSRSEGLFRRIDIQVHSRLPE